MADELAFSFERSGIPCSFYDLDGQGGTIHATSVVDSAEVAVVDTPGALTKDMGQWMAEADVIVIPTRTSSRDIEPLARMQRAAAKHSVPVVYVMNGWNRFKASREFLEWFVSQDKPLSIAKLPQAEAFVQAAAAGQSVVTFAPRTKAATSTVGLCNMVRQCIGIGLE